MGSKTINTQLEAFYMGKRGRTTAFFQDKLKQIRTRSTGAIMVILQDAKSRELRKEGYDLMHNDIDNPPLWN